MKRLIGILVTLGIIIGILVNSIPVFAEPLPNVTFTIATTLQGRLPAPNPAWVTPVDVWMHKPGAKWNETAPDYGAIYHFATSTNNTGVITLNAQPGNYDVHIKGITTLKSKFSNVAIGNGTVVNTGMLTEGDTNNDNVVDEIDISLFMVHFGSTTARQCDFNNDGVVDEIDISILLSKFGMVGAE